MPSNHDGTHEYLSVKPHRVIELQPSTARQPSMTSR